MSWDASEGNKGGRKRKGAREEKRKVKRGGQKAGSRGKWTGEERGDRSVWRLKENGSVSLGCIPKGWWRLFEGCASLELVHARSFFMSEFSDGSHLTAVCCTTLEIGRASCRERVSSPV